jgi:hypothetical protein
MSTQTVPRNTGTPARIICTTLVKLTLIRSWAVGVSLAVEGLASFVAADVPVGDFDLIKST